MSEKVGEPHGVAHVALAARHVLDVAGVGQHQLEVAVAEDVPDRLPVHAGRLHGDVPASLRGQPVRELEQVPGGRPEGAHLALDPAVDHAAQAGNHRVLVNVKAGAKR